MVWFIRKPFQWVADATRLSLRSQQIAWVFSRYALAESLGGVGIELGKKGINVFARQPSLPLLYDEIFGKKLAKSFIRLGPTFIKLGQTLATRPDLLGEKAALELECLFDRVPPISFGKIKKIIRSELGARKLNQNFKDIEAKPLASASLAQTHRATLKDGTTVIIKVQKPGSARLIRTDLLLLESLIRGLNPIFPRAGLLQMFEEFKFATLREIDYEQEAQNIKKFQKYYRKVFGRADVVVPGYYPDLCTKKVLTLDLLQGKKVADLKKGSTVARAAASQSMAAILEQVFDYGFFHADPHAGNLFFLEDSGQVGMIDFGLVGQLESNDKRRFLKVLLAVLQQDRARLASALYELGTASPKTNYDAYEQEVNALLDEVKRKGLQHFKMEELVRKLLAVARKNRIGIPMRYVLMLRTFLIIEGTAKSLDPNLSFAKVARPVVLKSLIRSYNPFRLFRA